MRARATILDARGETAAVEDARKGAIGLFREIDYPFWSAVTLYEHAAWLRDQQRETDAEPFVADARRIFTSLGAAPWLGRLDALGITTSSEAIRAG
jgi:hypothetical protein